MPAIPVLAGMEVSGVVFLPERVTRFSNALGNHLEGLKRTAVNAVGGRDFNLASPDQAKNQPIGERMPQRRVDSSCRSSRRISNSTLSESVWAVWKGGLREGAHGGHGGVTSNTTISDLAGGWLGVCWGWCVPVSSRWLQAFKSSSRSMSVPCSSGSSRSRSRSAEEHGILCWQRSVFD